jgi:alkanesulfonate monooxygenase SsuD/methylene tetrahydromethanopterin reductase-like flavin-dependent oxidoreductase (luciferase family)
MRYGVNLPPFADLSDVAALAELAVEAEGAGWDGFFLWDHVIFDPTWHPIADPWIALTAVALRTERIRLGTMVTPLARRRPWQVARQAATLDRLSGGRLVLGVGLGDPVQWDFGFFEEEVDARARARRLDEGLEIVTGLWSGEPFSYQGEHYRLDEMVFRPTPAQSPRIPIWVAGWWPNKPPLRRAARWDGVVPGKWEGTLTPDEVRELVAYVVERRTDDSPFDVVVSGETSGDDARAAGAVVAPLAEAGATWWIERVDPWRFGWSWEEAWAPQATVQMRERICQGPPRERAA